MEISKVMNKLLNSPEIISLKIKQNEMDFGLAYVTLFRTHFQNICVGYFLCSEKLYQSGTQMIRLLWLKIILEIFFPSLQL